MGNQPLKPMPLTDEQKEKYQKAREILKGYDRLAIAFSGGADSSLLLRLAHETLGKNVMALFADSVLQPANERQDAANTAQSIGVTLDIVTFDPLALAEFTSNQARRCYYCKKSIFSTFIDLAHRQNFPWLADGTNRDDLSQDRPGAQAVAELGVKSPLAEAGLTKDDVRQLSQALGLPTWNKPSASCLATRIPTNTRITATDLAMVDLAERHLHDLGYHGCRARLANTTFYLELASGDIARLVDRREFGAVRDYLHSLGAKKVFLDLLERASILA